MKLPHFENNSVKRIEIIRVNNDSCCSYPDDISIEEPLEIRVAYCFENSKVIKSISVTMRTPGNDAELAAGFLFTEGIIWNNKQIKNIYHPNANCSRNQDNIIIVELIDGFVPKLGKAERNFYTTSSCGVCGKGSIDSIRTVSPFSELKKKKNTIMLKVLYQLADKLRSFQDNFSATGGIHASGIFDLQGNLLALREDVGRHNALDKITGHSLCTDLLPLSDKILVLSGRASFELIQKAVMAGISIVAAIGAPSSLAVDLAKEFNVTLVGFLRDNRFNVYNSSTYIEIEGLLQIK